MFKHHKVEIEWGGRPLILETGKIARQADACVVATYGETSVMAAVVFEKKPKPGLDFFPLTIHYQERYYAAGKVPGGFFKREARPSEKEVLTSRLIDRPIRPLFASGFRNETQVICTVLSHDMENDPDIVAMVAASAALTISGIPFLGPIGAARVGFVDGSYVLTFAGYNAGPRRAREWVERYGDPRGRSVEDVVDWIERIPFTETRTYVQRVMENYQVYKMRLTGRANIALDLTQGRR
jgi:hypothetical protein